MQVTNNTNLATKSIVAPSNTLPVQARELRTRTLAQEESQAQKLQPDTSSPQRFDVDQQAIALIEREQLQLDNNGNNQQQTTGSNDGNSRYDAPSNQNQSAVAAYQSVDSIAQRDNIQQVFGVDLFA
ncbi:hypothetical protein [Cognaticolwellia mytili]|uniref:hypothetical protein n=1 Tax=Cognaticolwellia mytili TaxID=1888913 RepID=UPI000A16E41B|nr:hypothetical protein [Cognaticolwellia mytili]